MVRQDGSGGLGAGGERLDSVAGPLAETDLPATIAEAFAGWDVTVAEPDFWAIDFVVTDLLTVLCHELGHTLGLEDLAWSADSLMSPTLPPGLRRQAGAAEVDAVLART